jgi:hypothetical protein
LRSHAPQIGTERRHVRVRTRCRPSRSPKNQRITHCGSTARGPALEETGGNRKASQARRARVAVLVITQRVGADACQACQFPRNTSDESANSRPRNAAIKAWAFSICYHAPLLAQLHRRRDPGTGQRSRRRCQPRQCTHAPGSHRASLSKRRFRHTHVCSRPRSARRPGNEEAARRYSLVFRGGSQRRPSRNLLHKLNTS